MLKLANYGGNSTGHYGVRHLRYSELIMRWVDACTDRRACTDTAQSAVAPRSPTNRDQLVAVWVEENTTLLRTVS